ncbi:hypothetical protein BDN70DRAFT_801610 [Pholiota conissans]|uniref:Fungal-type protein kinase domain-containing protein n=1 Tax=Pholiota conissans TaxID=109636 RepID=A0A9P5Z825_9AGAR|nr:hypothetical protein BDN70DRAFT_801610 [Pholiota conissans]
MNNGCLPLILYALAFGNDKILGTDTRITIDRFTGDPKSVVVDKQTLKIITEIHASPFLFGRGTRAYIVKDAHGRYHIFKDSWAPKSPDTESEIDHIKKISSAAQGLPDRFRILCPIFVAGEDNVDDTAKLRRLYKLHNTRIRRRMVIGPIGDPITSYRSRVEFLQVMIDAVDQLKFIHDECGLVHGDISMNNIVIVRFLPNILAALPPPLPEPLSFPASHQITPCHKDGFPHVLKSGGSVIDFDYARASGTPAAEVSMTGSTPYTAIELMKPSSLIMHQLKHDLESVFLVLLNIVRLTWGPGATGDECKVKPHFRISQWHHERSVERLKDLKEMDVRHVCKDPMPYLTDYWAPIAPFMQRFHDVFYPVARVTESQAVYDAFKAVLIDAQNFCKTILEFVPNYAAFWNLDSLRKQKALDDDSSDDES